MISRPKIIQGGMGAGVSAWTLARAVSRTGELGVVSGTAIDLIVARRLQVGDPGGHLRRALAHFPIEGVARRVLDRYFVSGGKPADKPFKAKPVPSENPSPHLLELLIASNFAEVYLAKEGHDGLVGINYLEKIQLPHLPSLFGAMLAGVDVVLMGAGIPRYIPGFLDRLAEGEPVKMKLDVHGAGPDEEFFTRFDPASFCGGPPPQLKRPDFFAIISSSTLATMLARKATGRVDGFVVEGPTAGGHNAPPRGPVRLNLEGEPVYGQRDVADLEAIKALGRPFWLAGSYAEPERLAEALRRGAAGIQVGTAFAYCNESGLDPGIKKKVLAMSRTGTAQVFTDPIASPTGFPFKVLQMEGTHSDQATYEERPRICDLSYLRHAYKKADGKLGWRCPSEPVDDYSGKGGKKEDTCGRKCVCNGLMANIGLGQIQRKGGLEKPMITSGDDVANVARFLRSGADSYNAADVVAYLLRDVSATLTPAVSAREACTVA